MALSSIKDKLLSFVFHSTCCFCDEPIDECKNQNTSQPDDNLNVCTACYEQAVGDLQDRCYHCGAATTFENPFGSRCRICRNWNSHFERVISIGHYCGKMKSLILEIKRDCNDIKSYQLGQILGLLCEKLDLTDSIDCVVPVPSHWRRRLSRRGFHVSDVIAEGFCRYMGLSKYQPLRCVRPTQKQGKLRPSARKRNVRNAFDVLPRKSVQDMQILLLDDVMTSGATINECAKVLKKAGAASVFVGIAARATGVS